MNGIPSCSAWLPIAVDVVERQQNSEEQQCRKTCNDDGYDSVDTATLSNFVI